MSKRVVTRQARMRRSIPARWRLSQEGTHTFISQTGRWGGETWVATRDRLEVRSRWLRWTRIHRFTGARLVIDQSYGGGGYGGSVSRFRLWIRCGANQHFLHCDYSDEEVRKLGLLLAELTGWPLRTEH